MRIEANNPLHLLAQAYGIAVSRPVRHVAPSSGVEPVARIRPEAEVAQANAKPEVSPTARLVAATVPGGIDFSADVPQPGPGRSAQAMAMYRHPADKNAAATSVTAGRLVDLSA